MQNRNAQTFVNLLSSLLTLGITIAISFFLSPYIVKTLGEEANGFAQLANNFIMYAALSSIALNSMAGRFISISYHRNDLELANKYYTSLIIGNAVIMTILIVPAMFCIYKLDDILNISTANTVDVKILFSFVFIMYFIGQITGILNISTFVTNKLYINNSIGIIRAVLNALLILGIFSFFSPKIYYVSLVGLILSIVVLFATIIVKKKVLGEVKFGYKNFSTKYVWQMISSGLWNTVNQGGNILMSGFDLLLANLLIDPIQMGILSVAKIIPNIMMNLAATINNNFYPNLTIIYVTGDKKEMMKQLRSSMKISNVLISIPIMVFCVYGTEFYQLWMPTLDAKTLTVLSILSCMEFIPFAGTQALYNVFTTTNRLALNSITFIAGGAVNFVTVFILIKYFNWGIYAIAGVSSVISIIRNLIFTVPYTAKILKLKWYEFYKDVIISIICCLICGTISIIIKKIIVPQGWGMLLVAIAVSSALCCVCNILTVLNKDERIRIARLIFRKQNG